MTKNTYSPNNQRLASMLQKADESNTLSVSILNKTIFILLAFLSGISAIFMLSEFFGVAKATSDWLEKNEMIGIFIPMLIAAPYFLFSVSRYLPGLVKFNKAFKSLSKEEQLAFYEELSDEQKGKLTNLTHYKPS